MDDADAICFAEDLKSFTTPENVIATLGWVKPSLYSSACPGYDVIVRNYQISTSGTKYFFEYCPDSIKSTSMKKITLCQKLLHAQKGKINMVKMKVKRLTYNGFQKRNIGLLSSSVLLYTLGDWFSMIMLE
jgi:hypothetical protein